MAEVVFNMEISGKRVEVRGTYTPGTMNTYELPGDPEEFVIEEVLYENVNIINFVDTEVISEYFFSTHSRDYR